MEDEDLATKYRPKTLDDVVGQSEVIESLRDVLPRKEKAFLFTGPSGVGKTTLARIVCREKGVKDITEVDAATHTGIDAWREIRQRLRYRPQRGKAHGIIVDECHALSGPAWQSMLKDIEEPPKHVVWCFCTTEGNKPPKTIQSRCLNYELSPISYKQLKAFADRILLAEKHSMDAELIDEIAEWAAGSARQIIKGLSICWSIKKIARARKLLGSVAPESEAIQLCRGLLAGDLDLMRAVALIGSIQSKQPETIRLIIRSYFYKVAIGRNQNRKMVERAVAVLSQFSKPYYGESTLAPLLVDIAELLADAE